MNSAILHVCQHRYPYFRFGYSKQTIFSENDPARDKLQCVTGNYPKTRFSRWVEIEGKASCNLYYSVAPLINRKKIYCQIGVSFWGTIPSQHFFLLKIRLKKMSHFPTCSPLNIHLMRYSSLILINEQKHYKINTKKLIDMFRIQRNWNRVWTSISGCN